MSPGPPWSVTSLKSALQLMYEDLEITEIAERVGYHNYSNFYKAFKKAVGISPEEYRRQLNTFGK